MSRDDPRYQNFRRNCTMDDDGNITRAEYPDDYYDEEYRGLTFPGLGFRALQELFGRNRVEMVDASSGPHTHYQYVITLQTASPQESRAMDIAASMETHNMSYNTAEGISRALEELEGPGRNSSLAHFFNGGMCLGMPPGAFDYLTMEERDGKQYGKIQAIASVVEARCKNHYRFQDGDHTPAECASDVFPQSLLDESDAFKFLQPYNWSECRALRQATGVSWHIVDMPDGKEAFQTESSIADTARVAYELVERSGGIIPNTTAVMNATKEARDKITIPADLIDEAAAARIATLDLKRLFKEKPYSKVARP